MLSAFYVIVLVGVLLAVAVGCALLARSVVRRSGSS